jgi:hypothetical protein
MSNFNPVIAIIENTASNTFHPIVFCESPMPGETPNLIRVKSKMHHTIGFKEKSDAIKNINEELFEKVKDVFIGTPKLDLETQLTWNGNGIPAIVCFWDNNRLILL